MRTLQIVFVSSWTALTVYIGWVLAQAFTN